MSRFADFLPFVLPFVRDCSDPAAEVAVRLACVDFLRRSLWQREELEPVAVLAGVSTYELETPLDTILEQVLEISTSWLPQALTPKSPDELRQLYADWRQEVGPPRYYTQLTATDIRLVPSPDTEGTLYPLVALRPANDAEEVDDQVFQRWAEPIAYGARARLKETVGQPYYDPEGAAACWRQFYRGVGEAQAASARGLTRGSQRVQMRPWT